MDKIKALIIDMEGVLVRGSDLSPIGNATKFIKELNNKAVSYIIATNNSSLSPEEIHKRLRLNGFILEKEVILSPISVAVSEFNSMRIENIMVLGSDNLKNTLRNHGFKIVDDKSAQAVLVAKIDKMDLLMFKSACEVLLDGNKLLCGMNNNRLVLDDDSKLYPGPGAIIKMLEYAVDYKGDLIHFGKGSERYDDILINKLGHRWQELMMISDDPYTDLVHYQAKGCIGVFVTTGKYKKSQLSNFVPHRICNDLIEVLEWTIP